MPMANRTITMRDIARNLYALGPRYVYLKGGRLVGEDCHDLVYDGEISSHYRPSA